MTKARIKAERAPRIRQAVVDSIRPPTSAPAPSWLAMMRALDDLERVGGIAAVYPDSRVHAVDQHLDHAPEAFFQGMVWGYIEPKFGRRIILTDIGKRAVVKFRWGKLKDPTPPPPREPPTCCREADDYLFGPRL